MHVVYLPLFSRAPSLHYNGVIMSGMASKITSLTIVYSAVYSRRRSKKTSKLCVTGCCEGNSPVPGEFPAQEASNGKNISIWWRHHGKCGNHVIIQILVGKPWKMYLEMTCAKQKQRKMLANHEHIFYSQISGMVKKLRPYKSVICNYSTMPELQLWISQLS